MDYESIKAHFQIKQDSGDICKAVCPAHPDKEASLSIKYDRVNGKVLLKCFAGCETREIVEAAGLKISDLFDKELSKENKNSGWNITNVYKYEDETGKELFEKLRYKTKTKAKNFTQRRMVNGYTVFGLDAGMYYETYNGSGSYSMKRRKDVKTKDFPECRKVIYHLPEVIEVIKNNKEVFIVEGEKDADNLKKWGYVATCNPDGASKSKQKSKWKKEYNKYFENAKVIILHDNDDAGKAHAESIALNLYGVAEYIKCPGLPGLNNKEDISDWQEQGHTKEEFENILINTEIWDPSQQPEKVNLINFNFSDVGNAERLQAMYGKNIRYNPIHKKWLIWSGKHWEIDAEGKIEEKARKVIKTLQQQGNNLPNTDENKSIKQQIQKFVLRSESDNRIKAMINQAKTLRNLIINQTDKNVYLLNLQNGTLNLKTGTLQEHNKSNFITKCINIKYDKNANCPNWIEFINKIFNGNDELIDYIQKSIGNSLTGDADLQCFYILYGQGSNGKGTFMETIMSILGEYAGRLKGNSLIEKVGDEGARGDLAKLENKYLTYVNEFEDGRTFDEELMKSLTSGANEAVPVRRMYEEEFDLHPTFKIWIATNKLPKIKGTDEGIWRRVRKIPFEYSFEKDPNKDEHFFENKLKPELPGILNWCVEGCLKWQQEGIKVPEEVKAANNDYRSDMDTVQRFLSDCCIISETCKANVPLLYDTYKDWCEENKEYKLSSIKLTRKLSEKGFKQGRNSQSRYWQGLGIKEENLQTEMEECKDGNSPFWKNA